MGKKAKEVAKAEYEPTERELKAIALRESRKNAGLPHPRLKVTNVREGNSVNCQIAIDHEDLAVGWGALAASLGVSDFKVTELLVDQVAALAQTKTEVSQDRTNKLLAVVQELAPADPYEALLAVQMAAIHDTAMKQAATLNLAMLASGHTDTFERYSNSLNKLTRTFAAQMEALKRYRSKGVQKVVVEHQHIHVHPGAQAVVGDVYRQGAGEQENEGQPHEREPVRIPQRPPVLREVKADGMPMQGPGNEGVERLPVPRGKGRATGG